MLTQNAIDVAAATKAEFTAAIEALKQLIADIDSQNLAAKIVDSKYDIIFGDEEKRQKHILRIWEPE